MKNNNGIRKTWRTAPLAIEMNRAKNMQSEIKLDGSVGEGGGQILRTALSLSMITGKPFSVHNIRAKRPKSGLLRQHLTCVHAATAICDAQVEGAELGSTTLYFKPQAVKAGNYSFAIGSAGSCTLVFQTVLPALMLAEGLSKLEFSGGTHNSMAPPFQFLEQAFLPQLARMGVQVNVELQRYGFYPAGGGKFSAQITPCKMLKPFDFLERGALRDISCEAMVAGVPAHVALRELESVAGTLNLAPDKCHIRGLPDKVGPGNVLLLSVVHEQMTEVFVGFGEKSVSAERVAQRTVAQAQRYLASNAVVSEHLADQLMLPFALAGSGVYTATVASEHAKTNAAIIAQFLHVNISITEDRGLATFCFAPR